MSSEKTVLGRWGEALVGEWLHKHGYRLLASGYRCRMGEIDLIAQKGNTLAFVEVKLRKDDRFATAREQVPRPSSAVSAPLRNISWPSSPSTPIAAAGLT